MATVFNYWQDPGHGWVQVCEADLRPYGLTIEDFSTFSYRKGDARYLEEDCDASKFVRAFEEKNGHRPRFVERHSNNESFIRRLQPIR
jgi:hypothetical protein